MSSRTEPVRGDSRRWQYAVVALTLAALFVRTPGLDGGMWVDEIVSVVRSFRTPFPASLGEFDTDNKHPLYSLLAHASIQVFGEHPWSVRLPAMLAGVASVPLLYGVGALVTARAEAFAASALLALSYHHVWFSQNARGYSMLAMWTLLGTIALLRAIRGEGIRWWLLYALVSALGVYTHLTFVFPVIGQAVAVLAVRFGIVGGLRPPDDRGPILGFSGVFVFALILYAPMLTQVVAFFTRHQSSLKAVSTPGWALAEGIRVMQTGFGIAGAIGTLLLMAGAAAGVAGLVSYWRRQPLTMLLMVLPGMATLAGSLAAGRTIYPRFFLAFIGLALLVWMRGTFATAEWIAARAGWSDGRGLTLGLAVASAAVGMSALSVPLVWRAPKQDFAGAMRFVESAIRPGDAIVTADATSLVYGPYYRRSWAVVRNGAELERMRSSSPVWFVYAFPRYLRNVDPALGATVDRECGRATRFRGTLGNGDVFVCRLARL